MAYNTDPRLLDAIRKAPAKLQPVLLATTWVESGGRTDAVGDGGRSHGAFQEYDLGRGAGIPVAGRRDPYAATRRATREFQQYAAKGYTGGRLAAAAQRPAAQGAYAKKVDALLGQARQVLGGAATPAQRRSLNTALPSGGRAGDAAPRIGQQDTQAAPGDQGDPWGDAMVNALISNRGRPAGSMGKSLQAAFMQMTPELVGAPAVSQKSGVKKNPTGQNVPGNTPAPGVVEAAKRWLGTPYSWGGGTTSGPGKGSGRGANTVGFDCSSLVQNAWAKVGVQLPRTTYGQIKVGRAIATNNREKWQPGDLMFPHTGHVQMYVGNGKVIEAPRTGGHVQIVNARSSYMAVRRPRG